MRDVALLDGKYLVALLALDQVVPDPLDQNGSIPVRRFVGRHYIEVLLGAEKPHIPGWHSSGDYTPFLTRGVGPEFRPLACPRPWWRDLESPSQSLHPNTSVCPDNARCRTHSESKQAPYLTELHFRLPCVTPARLRGRRRTAYRLAQASAKNLPSQAPGSYCAHAAD